MSPDPGSEIEKLPEVAVSQRLLSVVIPMWNELEMLPRTIAAMSKQLDALVADAVIGNWELLFVDDASTDGCGELADEFAASDPRIVVRHHLTNRKLGGSIRTGLAAASGDLVLYTDADLPFDPAEIRQALHLLDLYSADVVAAYRLQRKGEGPLRFFYSYLYNTLVNAVLGLRIRDVNFAFKLTRRWVVDSVQLKSEGSFIDAELLARARTQGAEIIQFGVDYFPRTRGVSTLSSPAVILKMLSEMLSLGAELRRSTKAPTRRVHPDTPAD
jgi:glycosyltransferase involved in cell wall biosynthesis